MQGRNGGSANSVVWPRQPAMQAFWRSLQGFLAKVRIQRKVHALRVEETLPLGDKRFLALVRWNDETLLVGVTPQNITLLEPDANRRAGLAAGEPEPAA